MREREIQTLFKGFNTIEGVFELKLLKVRENGSYPPLPFSAVADHQIESLKRASDGRGLYHKISDGWVTDKTRGRRSPMPKPFDCIYLANVPAFVVVCYYVPRISKTFYYVPIASFIHRKSISTRKSLPYDLVRSMALHIG